jgi:hypothetical protein
MPLNGASGKRAQRVAPPSRYHWRTVTVPALGCRSDRLSGPKGWHNLAQAAGYCCRKFASEPWKGESD